ncbi:MAG: aminotransferase class V-fold PLP-dependent enzyme [Bacteroidota bacterium]|nr:aminotransferase class V-fold PLP-dependent enzyme [Bacteroidota bacterium]
MVSRLTQLEKESRRLEPDSALRKSVLKRAEQHAEEFLQNLDSMPMYVEDKKTHAAAFRSPDFDNAVDIDGALHILREDVDCPGLNPASGKHLGYIPGGGIYYSSVADYLAAVTNRYAGVFFASPGAVRMENVLLRWMAEIVGYPETAAGNLTSGGSVSNLTAVVVARDAHEISAKDFSRSVVYLTSQVHHSVEKALHIAGLGECTKRNIPCDEHFKMKPDALEAAIVSDKKSGLHPWLVVASAGSTDAGVVDPLAEIGEIASHHGVWYHIDGAYGAFFTLCDEGKKILRGIETSDSLVMDPHKGLFLPYGSGAVLVKDRAHALRSFSQRANYMQDAFAPPDELSPADVSIELSKHFRGLRLWLPLKLLGVAPFRAALEEKILLARYFFEKIQTLPNVEVGPPPDLSVVTFRFVPLHGNADEFNKRLADEIRLDGKVFFSSTMLHGKFTLRCAVLAFRVHRPVIDEALDILRKKSEYLMRST